MELIEIIRKRLQDCFIGFLCDTVVGAGVVVLCFISIYFVSLFG